MDLEANPKTWVPPVNNKDCSQGFCSIYCPQWCYIIFAPPPPIKFPSDNPSNPHLSPLKISIIGILATAFLLVSYYTISSKFCRNAEADADADADADTSRRRRSGDQNHDQNDNSDDNHTNSSLGEPWQQVSNAGLDESLIKLIRVCKYKHGDRLVEGTDCSICLGEFKENDSLRLLPKCSHAFHVACIDKWLKSHSNCPLCRANITFIASSPSPFHHPHINCDLPVISQNQSLTNTQEAERNSSVEREDRSEDHVPEETTSDHNERNSPLPKTPLRGFSNVDGDTVIEIREEQRNRVRRSVSMERVRNQGRLLVSDVLRMNQDDEECCPSSSESSSEESYRRRALEYRAMSPVWMKRSISFSSGKLLLGRQGRA